jgi:hypothetical protein
MKFNPNSFFTQKEWNYFYPSEVTQDEVKPEPFLCMLRM